MVRPAPWSARVITRRLRRRACGVDRLVAAMTARSGGAGPGLVIVPGLAVSRYLRDTQASIAEHARVHLLHLPGTGDADDAGTAVTVFEDAAAAGVWIGRHLRAPVVLVGHSYGAQVAARAAAQNPDLVSHLVLASPTVDPAVRSLPRLLLAWFRNERDEPAALRRVNRPEQRRVARRRFASMVLSALADDLEQQTDRVDAPLTVIRAERDRLCSQAWVRRLADRPGGAVVDVPGATHTFPFSRPDVLATVVRTVLERTDDARSRT